MYLAHISEDNLRHQSLLTHLQGTARRAGGFAARFGCEEWGFNCGYVHDIGKYSERFQRRLHGGPITDHATAGAQELYKTKNCMAAYCVAGHHSGLLDGGATGDAGGEATFVGRMNKELEDYRAFQKELELPVFHDPPMKPLGKGGFSVAFFIRMLFSCLVDADFLDTEEFMCGNDETAAPERGGYESIAVLLERLQRHVSSWLENMDESTINGHRSAILRACFEKGLEDQGLFQLTVPTGGGKTIASLAFALNHAQKHGLDRIIYVIPYTSIIEQNAQVFKDILGENNVLEDHCNVTYKSDEEFHIHQLAAENWDRPVVVTTNVQFFESLFSNRTSKCRKLHNIANSVVIFDEAQMLPVNYLLPCIRGISELVYNYHSTAVLCTATQPSLKDYFPDQLKSKVREICPDVRAQYEFFRRTYVKNVGGLSEEELIRELNNCSQVLCILNSRKRAQRVYEALLRAGEEDQDSEVQGCAVEAGIYHLSTLMYPAHRKRLLKEIRERLSEGKSCKLVATSLVEAGVDFDFQTVYRELAGLDSVIQAAGRCNREGRREKSLCETIAFKFEKSEKIHIPSALKLPIQAAEQVAERYEDLASPEAIEAYFKRLYHYKGESLDAKEIVEQFERGIPSYLFPFASVAEQFHLIENQTKTILIDIEPEAVDIVRRLRFGEHSRQLIRDAGHYCVNVYEKDFEHLNGAGKLEQLDFGFYRLRNMEQYSENTGLSLNVDRGDAVFA